MKTRSVLSLYKPLGQTPLQCIQTFQDKNPEYKHEKMCYAGRLDPMADGLLLVLVGDECTKRKKYQALPKEYAFDVLFGIETDTYDSLGLICHNYFYKTKKIDIMEFCKQIKHALLLFTGQKNQVYPPYSSVRVKGKPLFWWARKGKLDSIEIPAKQREIYHLDMIQKEDNPWRMHGSDIKKEVHGRANLVQGDFRQNDIVQSWDNEVDSHEHFFIASFVVSCSSGTYVRSLAHEMGKVLGTGAIAWRITRTRAGEFVM